MAKSYLMHHGILGMKWGVRRYQNYDGSYTKKGLEHYRESEANYNMAKQQHKLAKKIVKDTKKNGYAEIQDNTGTTNKIAADPGLVKNTKAELKAAKRQMSRDYDQLKRDKAGDIGKKLYQEGKTITGNAGKLQIATYIAAGTGMVAKYLNDSGKKDLAKYAVYAGAGMEAVNAMFMAKNAVEAHYLRAYYGHSRNKTNPRRE